MPVLIQFGAGNIGRGFIAQLFSAASWEVVFVDVSAVLVAELNRRGSYQVIEVDNETAQATQVGPVRAINGRDAAAVTAALATCDLAATAVGLGALPHLAPLLAAGALARGGRPLDVLVCENGARAAELLRQAVAERGAGIGVVRTSIGRMIPTPPPGGDLLDIRVEPYRHLPVERAAFRGPVPDVPGLEPVADFDLELRKKLYLHNLSHACLAYAGWQAGHRNIPECMTDAALVAGVRAAGCEAVEALARAYGHGDAAAVRATCTALLDDLLHRYRNRALADPVARVARDPCRKLAGDDRLIGALRLCHEHGVTPTAIARHVLAACRYCPAPDEPSATRFLAVRGQGPRAVLREISGLTDGDPVLAAVLPG